MPGGVIATFLALHGKFFWSGQTGQEHSNHNGSRSYRLVVSLDRLGISRLTCFASIPSFDSSSSCTIDSLSLFLSSAWQHPPIRLALPTEMTWRCMRRSMLATFPGNSLDRSFESPLRQAVKFSNCRFGIPNGFPAPTGLEAPSRISPA